MKVLLTGALGFLGREVYKGLSTDYDVISLGRQSQNTVICDLTQEKPLISGCIDAVVHAAGKAHVVPKSREEAQAFFDTNLQGTKNLLASLDNAEVTKFVFISSVAVYGLEEGELINESTTLDGNTPYAASKIEAEKVVLDWCTLNNKEYLILRLPLIVGSNPKGNLGKMIDAFKNGKYARIGKANAQKSMVLASDVSALILSWLTNENRNSGIYNLTDGYNPSFFEVEEALKKYLDIKWIPKIPKFAIDLVGKVGDVVSILPVNTATVRKITKSFTFSDEKARQELGWKPNPVLGFFLKKNIKN
jgi:nucleoside-diphosphate-sugar epimerase